MSKNIVKDFFRVFLLVFGFLIVMFSILSPGLLAYFWEDLQSLGTTALTVAVVAVFMVGVPALILYIKQMIDGVKSFKQKREWPKKTPTYNKVAPFLIIGIAFFGYTAYYPHWYYHFGLRPEFGPYLSYHAESGMIVGWTTRTETESHVLYGLSPDNLDLEEWGGEFYWQGANRPKTYTHSVWLDDLLPDTTYYYQIPSLSSEIHQFRSRPAEGVPRDIVFTILGDTQGNYRVQRDNIDLMKTTTGSFDNWDFTVIAGDIVNQDDNMPEWAMVMDSQSYGGVINQIPLMTSSGNHEVSRNYDHSLPRYNYKRYFQNAFPSGWENPDDNWDMGMYYSFSFSNLHMMFLDTFENKREDNLTATQLDWLEAELQMANAADMWTMVVFHLSMYSTSSHGPQVQLAEQLEPLMKEYEIDVMFWGHDHILEAFHAFSDEPYGGTHCFMVAGGGGTLKRVMDPSRMGDRVWEGRINEKGNYINIVSEAADNRFDNVYGSEWQVYAEHCHHYMQVEISGNTGVFTAYRTADGSIIDTYEISRG